MNSWVFDEQSWWTTEAQTTCASAISAAALYDMGSHVISWWFGPAALLQLGVCKEYFMEVD